MKGFDGVLVLNLNLIQISMKANIYYSHYKSKTIHQYKKKYIAAWMQQTVI
jgi:hypothetical protein